MKKIIYYCLFFSFHSIIFLPFSCNPFYGDHYINDSMKSHRWFNELPLPVQEIYLEEFGTSGTSKYLTIVNLDSLQVEMSHELLDTHGFYPSKSRFIIGDKKFILPWNSNKELYPFVLYNKLLYYRKTMNLKGGNIEYASYGVIHLEKYLDY